MEGARGSKRWRGQESIEVKKLEMMLVRLLWGRKPLLVAVLVFQAEKAASAGTFTLNVIAACLAAARTNSACCNLLLENRAPLTNGMTR